ncbi:MAG: nitrilase-related carbon-nitrogen hydrolase [Planctomycetota bacterium]|jgi:predicted amidohydrolase
MTIDVGFVQFAPERKEVHRNLQHLLDLLGNHRDGLIVTPELALTGYLFEDQEELREVSMAHEDFLLDPFYRFLKSNRLVVALGFPEKAEGVLFNSLLLAGPGGPIAVYRKIHLFDREKTYFFPGNTSPPVVTAGGTQVGLMICWDWYFPETARYLARKGARVIAHAANLVLPYCQDAMRTRALENRVFIITANRTGAEEAGGDRKTFSGRSQVVDPDGERVLAVGGDEVEGVFTVAIDPARAEDKAMTPRNSGPWEVRRDLLM